MLEHDTVWSRDIDHSMYGMNLSRMFKSESRAQIRQTDMVRNEMKKMEEKRK